MSQLFYTPEEVDVNERGEFETLIIPESFEQALSYAEQLIWLYKNKQNKLVEGGGVTLTDNADGTTTISVSSDIKGIESIESTVGTTKTVVKITLTDGSVETFDVMAGPQGPAGEQGPQGPQGPAGADGRQGVDGVGISSINYVRTEMASLEVERRTISRSGAIDTLVSHISVPRYNIYNIVYTNGDIGILNMYTGNTEYISRTTIDNHVTPREVTYQHSMYNTVTNTSSVLHSETIKDGEKGDSGDFPSGGENGNVLVKNSNATDGVEWISPDGLSPRVGSWFGSAATIAESPIPTVINGYNYTDPDEPVEVPINLAIQIIDSPHYNTGGLVVTLENTSADYEAQVFLNYELLSYMWDRHHAQVDYELDVDPTYGSTSGDFITDNTIFYLVYYGIIPAGETETFTYLFTNADDVGLTIPTDKKYEVSLLYGMVAGPDESGRYTLKSDGFNVAWEQDGTVAGSWNGDIAMINNDPIPNEVIGYDYATQTEQIPVSIEFEKVYTNDELTGIIFRAHNTSDDETVIVNYDCNMWTNGADVPVVNDVIEPTYGSGGFWYNSTYDTIAFGVSLEIPAGGSDTVECSITTTLPGFDVDTTQTYIVNFLDAKNGVPDASQASSGDVLTADGSGGCDWQTPSGGVEVDSSNAIVTDSSRDNISAQGSGSFLESFFSTNRPSNCYFIITKLDVFKIGNKVVYKSNYGGAVNSITSNGVSFGLFFNALASDYVVSQNTMGYLQHRLTSAQYNNLPQTIREATTIIRIPAVFEISFSSTVNFYGDKFRKTFLGFLIFSTTGYCYFDIPNGSMNGETIPAGSNRMLVNVQI